MNEFFRPNWKPTFFWTINFLFLVAWISLAFGVSDRSVWILENVLVILLAPIAFIAFKRGLISRASYFLVFLFLLLHIVGAHYTYSRVPYQQWLQSLGFLSFQRNQYDRLVHFAFGALLFLPLTELFKRKTILRGRVLLSFTVFFLISCSSAYELLEWAVAITFGGNVGPEYVGTQGDPWDAQKDQALALLGMLVALIFNLMAISKSIGCFASRKMISLLRRFLKVLVFDIALPLRQKRDLKISTRQ